MFSSPSSPFCSSLFHSPSPIFALLFIAFVLRFFPIRADIALLLPDTKCRRPGDRFVQEFIEYECAIASPPVADESEGQNEQSKGGEVSFDAGSKVLRVARRRPQAQAAEGEKAMGGKAMEEETALIGRPIGCAPSNKEDGTVVRPGTSLLTKHFRYECAYDEASDTVTMKISHCVDHDGKLVKVGEFFTHPPADNNSEQFTRVECVGNEFMAKKVVHKWSNCALADGKKLVEGDFTVQEVPRKSARSQLQKSEIVACLHEEGNVRLKCTGCVATNGQEMAVSRFANVAGQWTQCRRFREGCRMINVTNDYIDCQLDGTDHKHGATFESASKKSLFICSHGQIIKQGCFIQNRELTLVGDVKYIDGVTPALCGDSDNFTLFGGIVGCDLPDGRFKRFMDVWRDGDTMKRCSWAFNSDGSIARADISTYACLDGSDVFPLNKIIQREGGQYMKCVQMDAPMADDGSAKGETNGETLGWRNLTDSELIEMSTKKLAKQNLVEYFGVGRRAAPLLARGTKTFDGKEKGKEMPFQRQPADCADFLPFCPRLSGYCHFMSGPLERGLVLDAFSELRELQKRFDQFGGSEDELSLPMGCEKQPSIFQKLQLLVELACQQTCKRCANGAQKESALTSLESTSHCGK
ncbi:hypothetical protein niasHS_012085 [Heterodera schachtii]|uniref:Abnormal cell migration protein 18-like fibronectin type I domain-containing protein n=1 Tax=Heterodera schachtii TaxID=97005 RepID=A0ABD2IXZ6_HETSC